jgi:RES domain-containing protein
MKLTAWRIANKKHADTLFSGEGAELYGGRFNSPGAKVVYTSASLSLALLELLVQGGPKDRLSELVCAQATFDSRLVAELDEDDLPEGWNSRPPGSISQSIGDQWISQGKTPVLRIPSVVVPDEFNYLLNPQHTKFAAISIGSVRGMAIDERLI